MVTRAQIVSESRKMIGWRWVHKGRSLHGVDCIGVPVMVGRVFELNTPAHESLDYPRRPDGTFIRRLRAVMVEKKVSDAQDGDIIVFAEGNHPCHMGIRTTYAGQSAVIHSHAGRGKVLEETLESAQSIIGRPVYCFCYNGIED